MLIHQERPKGKNMRFPYLITQAVRRRKGWGSNLALIIGIASSFLVLGSFLLITLNLKEAGQKLKGEVQVEVYLKSDITPLQLHMLLQGINRSPEVERVEYRSSQVALAQLSSYLGGGLLEGLEANPLPASFRLGLKDEFKGFEQVSLVADRIRSREGVEDIEFGGAWLQNLDKAMFVFLMVDVVFGLIITISIIMMVSNFMHMVVLSQAESLQIMSLLGASRKDLYLPLIIQGGLLGVTGALLGMLLLGAGHLLFTGQVVGIDFLPFPLILGMIVFGMILAMCGTLLSIKQQSPNQ
jgi:cell division transport system permease protein